MKISKIEVGPLLENCYVLEKNNEIIIIDPGDEYTKIQEKVNKKQVVAVLITHYHFDHVGALDSIIENHCHNVMDFNCKAGVYKIGSFEFELINTPGHKEDAVSFYFKNNEVMFVGDFIFKGTIGRYDLSGGNYKEMIESLLKIKKYDPNTLIYPGHGSSTTLFDEFKTNPYFLSLEEA
ncbi:MAG: MBL fold metallo-hydrolase [Bacilli bacterium]